MKLRLLLGIVFFGLMSCSGDDSNETVNTNEPVTGTPTDSIPPTGTDKILKETKRYRNGELVELLKYTGGRQTERLLYNNNGQTLFLKDINTFDSESRLIKNVKELTDGTDSGEQEITYDSSGRISLIKTISGNGSINIVESFIYSNSQIISDKVTTQRDDYISYQQTLYEINSAGYIYKVTVDTENPQTILTATYDANNRINTLTTSVYYIGEPGTVTTTINNYEYDLNTEVKTGAKGIFGNNRYNNALYTRSVTSFNNRYVSKITNQEHTYEYIYEFDTAGYLSVRKSYDNGELFIEEHMTYE